MSGAISEVRKLYSHAIQSFAPGEVTPEQANEIGLSCAGQAFGFHSIFVVSTHYIKYSLKVMHGRIISFYSYIVNMIMVLTFLNESKPHDSIFSDD